MKKVLMAVIIGVTLAGCVTHGNSSLKHESETTVSSKIVLGVTTRADIKKLFGAQLYTKFTDSGKEIWVYKLSDMDWDNVNYIPIVNLLGSSESGTYKQLVVMFNGDKVMRFTMTESPVITKTGIFK